MPWDAVIGSRSRKTSGFPRQCLRSCESSYSALNQRLYPD